VKNFVVVVPYVGPDRIFRTHWKVPPFTAAALKLSV
jgi:hypothetical protein